MTIGSFKLLSPTTFLDEEIRCDFAVTRMRKKLWQIQMELFQVVDLICRKYKIEYFAIGGTLLGAVRHCGFIPWDDDIDIAMFRSDYERFVQVAMSEISDPFFVQSPETENDYALSHIKIRNSKTTGAAKYDFEFKYNKGVFIDVFPIDNVPNDLNEKKELLKGVHDFRKTLDVGARHFWYWQGVQQGTKEIITQEEKSHLSDIVKQQTIPGICKEFDRFCSKYNDIDTDYCGILALELTSERFFWKRDWFKDSCRLPFEYLSILCPKNFDAVLRKTYGEYTSYVRGGALHGSLIFDPDVSYTDFVLTDNPPYLI